ncbi:hypothetical protein COO91_08085 [Nostoc flagelliforme CCNUN1]|uniref:Uncharacterized protein n=1 Tax=Nostoc flagelliforme CCNUN1 TaxID=2038116 RepID=A0A2K8T2Z7_9NOSO|nr:hypothetical protein COO91_08085 [Nostoc flagelliforme CCNUN1]
MRSLVQTKPHLHDYSVRNTSFQLNGIDSCTQLIQQHLAKN